MPVSETMQDHIRQIEKDQPELIDEKKMTRRAVTAEMPLVFFDI